MGGLDTECDGVGFCTGQLNAIGASAVGAEHASYKLEPITGNRGMTSVGILTATSQRL